MKEFNVHLANFLLKIIIICTYSFDLEQLAIGETFLQRNMMQNFGMKNAVTIDINTNVSIQKVDLVRAYFHVKLNHWDKVI